MKRSLRIIGTKENENVIAMTLWVTFNLLTFLPFYPSTFLPLFAQNVDFGVGVNIMPGGGVAKNSKEEKKEPPRSIFVEHLAKKMNKDTEKLQGLWRRGYGYVELIKLLLITDASNQPLEKIIEMRDKKEKLSAIARKFNIDYKDIRKRANKIKGELDEEVELSSSTITVSSPAITVEPVVTTEEKK